MEREYLTNEEAVEVIKTNAKNWFKKNWKKVVVGTLMVVGAGIYLSKKPHSDDTEQEGLEILDILQKSIVPNSADIDEDIFTNVAPEIEELVLCEGLDEGYIERTYTVKYPRWGDPEKGYYGVNKKVRIHVVDVGEEES